MDKIGFSKPVKLVIGFIAKEDMLIEKAKGVLEKKFGPIDFQSNVRDFDFTTYYNDELGEELKRRFISFKKLIKIENAHIIKVLTNRLEAKFSIRGQRRINIDPGYISLSKLVLFTTKDFYHRIYLGKGIYAEVTLYYKDKTFRPFEWSYPDYRTVEYIEFFNGLREDYKVRLRHIKC
ncbi:MAG: DUF4416 family protein [Candidatus Omnitrophica bacterium]|nr:DUF4416 family protein [Candidatus Omnitrophota bacterium]